MSVVGAKAETSARSEYFVLCEGFRMTADRDDAACTGAVVRKPPMKMLWGKRRDSCKIVPSINLQLTELRMQKPHDNSKASPAAFMQDNTLIAVIELSLSNWLVAGLIPGV